MSSGPGDLADLMMRRSSVMPSSLKVNLDIFPGASKFGMVRDEQLGVNTLWKNITPFVTVRVRQFLSGRLKSIPTIVTLLLFLFEK